jgi:hypothetical protein
VILVKVVIRRRYLFSYSDAGASGFNVKAHSKMQLLINHHQGMLSPGRPTTTCREKYILGSDAVVGRIEQNNWNGNSYMGLRSSHHSRLTTAAKFLL